MSHDYPALARELAAAAVLRGMDADAEGTITARITAALATAHAAGRHELHREIEPYGIQRCEACETGWLQVVDPDRAPVDHHGLMLCSGHCPALCDVCGGIDCESTRCARERAKREAADAT